MIDDLICFYLKTDFLKLHMEKFRNKINRWEKDNFSFWEEGRKGGIDGLGFKTERFLKSNII